ncbi:MAG: hypothetical protein R3F11_01375 [Verrucomicrobiales bacterium]
MAQRWVVAGGAAAGIALLWLLRQAADREARKRYGVLQWCLALSAALHLLAAFAFSLWVIAEAVVKADDEPMEVAVNPKALAKEKLALQIRGNRAATRADRHARRAGSRPRPARSCRRRRCPCRSAAAQR